MLLFGDTYHGHSLYEKILGEQVGNLSYGVGMNTRSLRIIIGVISKEYGPSVWVKRRHLNRNWRTLLNWNLMVRNLDG